jgi:hypothetical protein
MKKSARIMMAGSALVLPLMASAAPTATVYGQLHLSVDYVNSDISKTDENADSKLSAGSIGLSSNSSRFGLKGDMDTGVEGLKAIYQIEQGINVDGDDGDTLATRNTFLGVRYTSSKTLTLELLGGRYDSLAKGVMGKTLFKDNVADYGAIFGAGKSGNKFDKRIPNMVMGRYIRKIEDGSLTLSAQVSSDYDDKTSQGNVDDNKATFHALGLDWSQGNLGAVIGYDHWNNYASSSVDADLLRGAFSLKSGAWTGIVLAENLRQSADLNRKAYGVQVGYKSGQWSYAGQVLQAQDYRDSSDTGATMFSLSAQQKLSDALSVYGVATRTHNEDNASYYGISGGHGDKLATVADANPYALSVGAVLAF